MNNYYVYELIDARNDTVFYVGKGKEKRMFYHENKINHYNKYLEKKIIEHYGIKNLCNMTYGGEGTSGIKRENLFGERNPFFGKKHSAEAKEKIRQAKLGQKMPDNIKNKISEKLKGSRTKENNPFYGKTHSKEHRLKMSLAMKNYHNQKRGD